MFRQTSAGAEANMNALKSQLRLACAGVLCGAISMTVLLALVKAI